MAYLESIETDQGICKPLLWLKSYKVKTKDNSCIGVYKRTW